MGDYSRLTTIGYSAMTPDNKEDYMVPCRYDQAPIAFDRVVLLFVTGWTDYLTPQRGKRWISTVTSLSICYYRI